MTLLSGAMAMVLSMAGVSSTQETVAAASASESAMSAQQHAAPPVMEKVATVVAASVDVDTAAQSAPAAAPAHVSVTPAPTTHASGASHIPANTAVVLETQQALSSLTLKHGDLFALRLAEPVLIDGVQVLPAGTSGVGQVVHAERARAAGKAGELLLAARYLEHNGRRIALRSFRLGANGVDRTKATLGVAVALGVAAFLVRGGNIEIPAQTRAQALTAQDVNLSAQAAAASSAGSAPASSQSSVPPNTQPSGEAVQ
jgi:hypothetical protein